VNSVAALDGNEVAMDVVAVAAPAAAAPGVAAPAAAAPAPAVPAPSLPSSTVGGPFDFEPSPLPPEVPTPNEEPSSSPQTECSAETVVMAPQSAAAVAVVLPGSAPAQEALTTTTSAPSSVSNLLAKAASLQPLTKSHALRLLNYYRWLNDHMYLPPGVEQLPCEFSDDAPSGDTPISVVWLHDKVEAAAVNDDPSIPASDKAVPLWSHFVVRSPRDRYSALRSLVWTCPINYPAIAYLRELERDEMTGAAKDRSVEEKFLEMLRIQ
jgi:hypothetical protein